MTSLEAGLATSRPSEPDVPAQSVVIYTAISGRYDRLKTPAPAATAGVELVAFLDRPARRTAWQYRPLHQGFADPSRNAKIHKILSHAYFPDKLYSLWMDGSIRIAFSFPVQRLIDRYLADCDLALFPHYRRTCLYQEAQHCIHVRADAPNVIRRQIERYTRDGYPANAGLSECSVLLRRHTDAVRRFNEAWWEEIGRGSRRDQLSFPYVARRCGLNWRYFPGSLMEPGALFRRDHHRGRLRVLLPRRVARFIGLSWRDVAGFSTGMALPVLSTLHRRRLGPLGAIGGPAGTPVPDPANGAGAPPTARPAPIRAAEPADGRRAPRRSRPASGPRLGPTLAFGPERDYPSWNWVGFDTSRELSKHYPVNVYNSWSEPPACDVLFIIKERPPEQFVAAARRAGRKIVYSPIDVYESHEQLAGDAAFLRACDMVLVHCERLLPLIRPYCPRTYFVEHHCRYALPKMREYPQDGFILWVGGLQYIPHLIGWLREHPIGHEIRILTDVDNDRARYRARLQAAAMGLPVSISRLIASVPDCQVYPWTERHQLEMMRECKAALDVKATDQFNQWHKPPVKAQKYVASGIPFAVNAESYSAEYFRDRGFTLASPDETDRWLSREYWQLTRAFGERLRASTSLEAVGQRYRDLIHAL